MPTVEIPGYYYDEEKRKYFKITNGGVGSQYHNNIIQAKKRRIDYEKEKLGQNTYVETKKDIRTIKQIQKWKHTTSLYDLNKVKLGLCHMDKLSYDFEMVKGLQYWKSTNYDCNEIRGKFKDKYFISTDFCKMYIFEVDEVSGTITQSGTFDELKVLNYRQQLVNRGLMLIGPEMNMATDGNLIFKYIAYMKSSKIVGMVKFEKQTPTTRVDITMKLLAFLRTIRDNRVKQELMLLFGVDLVCFESGDYYYSGEEFKNNCKVTDSLMQDNQLIIGTSRGYGYSFDYSQDGDVYNVRRFNVRNRSFRIKKIKKKDKNMFISGSTDQLFILDNNMRISQVISHSGGINNFNVRENDEIIVVGLKSIKVYSFKDPNSKPLQIDYFNDNITHQISLFEENFFLVNQSHQEILAVHYSNYEKKILILNHEDRYLVNFTKLFPGLYLFHWDQDGENVYDLHKL